MALSEPLVFTLDMINPAQNVLGGDGFITLLSRNNHFPNDVTNTNKTEIYNRLCFHPLFYKSIGWTDSNTGNPIVYHIINLASLPPNLSLQYRLNLHTPYLVKYTLTGTIDKIYKIVTNSILNLKIPSVLPDYIHNLETKLPLGWRDFPGLASDINKSAIVDLTNNYNSGIRYILCIDPTTQNAIMNTVGPLAAGIINDIDVARILINQTLNTIVLVIYGQPPPAVNPLPPAPGGAPGGAPVGLIGGYKQKYLKYKEKYLALKNSI